MTNRIAILEGYGLKQHLRRKLKKVRVCRFGKNKRTGRCLKHRRR